MCQISTLLLDPPPLKFGSQIRQIVRSAKTFIPLLPSGCLVVLHRSRLFHLNLLPISLLFQLPDIILHYMMSLNSSLNFDDLFDLRKDTFNYQLRPTTHFIQRKPNR